MAEPAADTLPDPAGPASTTNQLSAEAPAASPPTDTTTTTNNNPQIVATNSSTEETPAQNISFELNGEQVSICEVNQSSDGQIYLMLQSEKGHQYIIQDQNALDLFSTSDGVQLSSLLQLQESKTNADNTGENQASVSEGATAIGNDSQPEGINQLNLQPAEPLSAKEGGNILAAKTSIVTLAESLKAAEIVPQTLVVNSSAVDSSSNFAVKSTATLPKENGKSESDTVPSKHTNSLEIAKTNTKQPLSRKSPIAQNDQSLKPQTKIASGFAIKTAPTSSIMDNFPTKSQLANSPKTYSRPKNIQWITPSMKNGLENSEESGIEKKAILTTTIEIADESDEYFSPNTSYDISGDDHMEGDEQPLPPINNSGKIILNRNINITSITQEVKNGLLTDSPKTDKRTNNIESNEANLRKTVRLVNVQSSSRISPIKVIHKELNKPDIDVSEPVLPKRGRRSSLIKELPEKTPKSKEIPSGPGRKRTRSNDTKELAKEPAEKSAKSVDLKSRKNVTLDANSLSTQDTKAKDSRAAEFFEDIEKTKDKRKCVIHIRIQPSERNESREHRFVCPQCDFDALSFYSWTAHKETCSLFDVPGSTSLQPSRVLSRESIMEKITFKPFTFKASNRKSGRKGPIITSESEEERVRSDDDDEFCFHGFKKDDIIWTPTSNHGLWPALIMKIFPQERKFSVKLIEYPWKKASLITDVDRAIPFSEGVEKKKWKGSSEEILVLRAVSKAEEYSRKKLITEEVEVIDPKDFFNFSQTPKPSNRPHNIQVESLKIVNFIKDGEVDAYLCSIYEEKILSERHKKFRSDNKNSGEKNSYGPITDEEHQTDLYSHIINLFKSKYENTSDLSESDQFSYCYSVWLPEAIIKAITKLYPFAWMNIKTAEEIFNDESVKKTLTSNLNTDEL